MGLYRPKDSSDFSGKLHLLNIILYTYYLSDSFFKINLFLTVPHGMWDPSSLTRDWNHTPCVGSAVLTTGSPGKSPSLTFLTSGRKLEPHTQLYCRAGGIHGKESLVPSASKIKGLARGFWPVSSVTLCETETNWRAQELSLCRLCFLESPPGRPCLGYPTDTNHPHWCHWHCERWWPLAKQVIISFLTSLGNSSALHEEAMDLSPILGEQNSLGWSELSYKEATEWEGPFLYHHLAKGTCQPALLPTPRARRAHEMSSSDTSPRTPPLEPSAALPVLLLPHLHNTPKHRGPTAVSPDCIMAWPQLTPLLGRQCLPRKRHKIQGESKEQLAEAGIWNGKKKCSHPT